MEVALGAKRRVEDMEMVVCDQLRSEGMTIDGSWIVGRVGEKAFLVVEGRKVGRSSQQRKGANLN